MGFNQGLVDGQKLALQRDSAGKFLDARRVKNWKFYRAWEEPGENPMPLVLTPVLQYEENDVDSLTLDWTPIDEVNGYRLLVIKTSLADDTIAFVDTAVSMITMQTSVKIPALPVGNYIWFVEPLIEVSMGENENGEEYFYMAGDEAAMQNSQTSPILKKSWWKKVKKWAKKTVKKAIKYIDPVAYFAFYGGNVASNTWSSFKSHLNPFSVIQIFIHTETLHTRTNSITKNIEWLQKSYSEDYRYKRPDDNPSEANKKLFNECFGEKSFCAMKDTRMLAENWTSSYNSFNWNKVFPRSSLNGRRINDAVKNRCWLTMAQMINHYKGGNISEDEILYNVRGGLGNTDSGGPIETMQAVNYALCQNIWDKATYSAFIDAYEANKFCLL